MLLFQLSVKETGNHKRRCQHGVRTKKKSIPLYELPFFVLERSLCQQRLVFCIKHILLQHDSDPIDIWSKLGGCCIKAAHERRKSEFLTEMNWLTGFQHLLSIIGQNLVKSTKERREERWTLSKQVVVLDSRHHWCQQRNLGSFDWNKECLGRLNNNPS